MRTRVFWRGEQQRARNEYPKDSNDDDEASNVHLLWIWRHWYRYTIEQSLEKRIGGKWNLVYQSQVLWCIEFDLLFIDTWNENKTEKE